MNSWRWPSGFARRKTVDVRRPLLLDPSGRGGIATHTDRVCQALLEAGARPGLLASRELERSPAEPYRIWRRLPITSWGRPQDAGARFIARRLVEWASSSAHAAALTIWWHPGIIDFQAAFNRRFDALLIAGLRRFAPVVWTAHNVLPFDRTAADRDRFASIYSAVDLVIAHNPVAAEQVRELSGADPVVLELLANTGRAPVEQAEARRMLGLPREGRVLGALGFIRSYKGYDLLADVWERLGDQAPLLLVMGEVMDQGQMPVLRRLDATGRSELRLGYASDNDLHLAFSAVDALLLPHEEASTSGLAATARSMGILVITSDLPEIAGLDPYDADRLVPRTISAWAEAVSGDLPPQPTAQRDDLAAAGRARLDAYAEAERRWRLGAPR